MKIDMNIPACSDPDGHKMYVMAWISEEEHTPVNTKAKCHNCDIEIDAYQMAVLVGAAANILPQVNTYKENAQEYRTAIRGFNWRGGRSAYDEYWHAKEKLVKAIEAAFVG